MPHISFAMVRFLFLSLVARVVFGHEEGEKTGMKA